MTGFVGIDLGTTTSSVSVLLGGQPMSVPNALGSTITPSVVAFVGDEVIVGERARRQMTTNPHRTVRSVKRRMGTNWTIDIDGKPITPQQISAFILRQLKEDAEEFLGDTVRQAVITVPAYFDEGQRIATKEAGQIAGLEVLRIISEPTAAALAYGLDQEGDQTILVFSLGGGSMDVSVLEMGEGVFEVKATCGDTHLGGDDWDQRIVDWLVATYKGAEGVDLARDPTALLRLTEAAESAKIELSYLPETVIDVPYIEHRGDVSNHLNVTLTRAKFEQMTADLVEACRTPLAQVLADSLIPASKLHHVIVVGGAARIPAVVSLVRELTGNAVTRPREDVATGAVLQAGVLMGRVRDLLLMDVVPFSLGVETDGGIMTKLIDRNTTIPTRRSETFTTTSHNQSAVDIHVLQGDDEMASRNRTAGRLRIEVASARRGKAKVQVTFDIDANGIIQFSAKDMETGIEQSMTISDQAALSRDDIGRMIRDHEANAEAARRRKVRVELDDYLETMVHEAQMVMRPEGTPFTPKARAALQELVDQAKYARAGNSIEGKRRAVDHIVRLGGPTLDEVSGKGATCDSVEVGDPPRRVPGGG